MTPTKIIYNFIVLRLSVQTRPPARFYGIVSGVIARLPTQLLNKIGLWDFARSIF